MEMVPFSFSSLDSFDQSDQRDTSSPCDKYFPVSQCDQQRDTVLQGDTTNTNAKQLQSAHHHVGVKPTVARNLSIFRPRFRSDYQYYEQAEQSSESNQASSDFSFEETDRCPTVLQHKRFVQSSGKARQVSVGCENTFSSPRPSFDISISSTNHYSMNRVATSFTPENEVVESREDSVGSERENDLLDADINACVHQTNKRNDAPRYMGNSNYMSISASVLSEKRKRQDIYNAETTEMAGNTWSRPSTCSYRAILATRAKLFTHFTFLLPDLKTSVMNYVANQKSSNNWVNENQTYEEVIARRRLICAVQAYGGNMFRCTEKIKRNVISSIFRRTNDELANKTNSNDGYEEKLQLQYFENGSHLSWDVEEAKQEVRQPFEKDEHFSTEKVTVNVENDNLSTTDQKTNPIDEADDSTKTEDNLPESDDGPKLKYRCKLCGQPKQNHSCPFQQALQRNIGTMTFTALNAFQSHEPGELATSLSEMNNFVDLDNDDDDDDDDEYPNVTTNRTVLEMMPSFRIPENEFIGKRRKTRMNSTGTDRKYKGDEKLFHKPMEFKPEQYRSVSVHKSNLIGDYKYPTLPLTFDQRKGASEDLFQLCQEISGLTDDCAKVLHVARNTELWDLAVAELITQILVAIKCVPGDETLEGLRKHLMLMGFSS